MTDFFANQLADVACDSLTEHALQLLLNQPGDKRAQGRVVELQLRLGLGEQGFLRDGEHFFGDRKLDRRLWLR